jgi:hypothetical protein
MHEPTLFNDPMKYEDAQVTQTNLIVYAEGP